jgi:hypothetical protein
MTPSNTQEIREHMPVVCSDGGRCGTVDRVEDNTIKLTKDDQGHHHWIPTDWVTRVDQDVQVDRPIGQVRRDWSMSPPSSSPGSGPIELPSAMETAGRPASTGMEGEEGGVSRS